MERSILGFDVIKEILQDDRKKDVLANSLTKLFRKSSKIQAMFKSMQ